MAERGRSIGAMLITAPSDDERLYEMAVRITKDEYAAPHLERAPWVKVRAELASGEIYLSAGVKVRRRPDTDEDGA